MFFSRSFIFTLFNLSLCTLALGGSPHLRSPGRHIGKARLEQPHDALEKRYSDAKFTWYDAGQNACGSTDSDNDWVVAVSSDQFGNGKHCFKTIAITYNGQTTQAKITDECPGCKEYDLDMSKGLFSHLASPDQGVIYGNWVYNS